MKFNITTSLAIIFSSTLLAACGGSGQQAVQPRLLAQGGAVQPVPVGKQAPTQLAQIAIDDIDKGTFCYAENVNPNANISDLKSAFNGNNWLQTITGVYARRWPSGQALAQAQANDQYFKNFVDTTSFNKLAESLMVAIHEETHMWDLASGRTEWNNYTSAWVDQTFQFNKMPLHDGFARKEILPLIKDDASSETDKVYLHDANQGTYHLQGVTAELNASLMGLPAALMVAEFIDGVGASNSRDLALTNMNYLQLYLRVAKQNYPQFWQKIKAEPQLRKFVLVQFLRMSYFVNMSTPWASKLGSSKVPALLARVYAPENIAIMEEFSGYKFPTRLEDHCMGGGNTTPLPPSITSQPQSLNVALGQSASFAVSANGSNLRYQWRKNGVNLANATSAGYTISAAALADAGAYSVVVSNELGSVTSNSAQLTVSAATAGNLIQNGGFENGSAPWQGTLGVIGNFSSNGHPAYEGTRAAWLGGNGATHNETLYQQVSIPASATSAGLNFQMAIDTAETGTTVKDRLQVQVLSSSGSVLATLATYSNLQAGSGYRAYNLNLLPYKGQTVRIQFKMTEDARLQTSFVLDKVELMVQGM